MPYITETDEIRGLGALQGGWLSKKVKQVKKAASKVGSNIKNAGGDVSKALKENAETILVIGAIAMPVAGGLVAAGYGVTQAQKEKKKAEAEAKKIDKETKRIEAEADAAAAAEAGEQAKGPGIGKVLGIVGAAAAGLFLISQRRH
jgi:hypothetical protein